MRTPSFIELKLKNNGTLSGLVQAVLARVERHILANKPEFFEEYTDHSVRHVEAVMETAADLIGKETIELSILTQEDAAVLAISVALHDFGMYLTRDGFESLTDTNSRWKGVAELDSKSWKELWIEFSGEASRFDQKKLLSLFGENFRPVRRLPMKGEPWDDFDRKLVGEFIRRHHPRLAHEIAIYGMPAKDGSFIEICPTDPDTKVLSKYLDWSRGVTGIQFASTLTTSKKNMIKKFHR